MSLHPLVVCCQTVVINLPIWGGLETEWIILGSQGFLPLCYPGEAIWARGELISHKQAASLIPCGHLITHKHPDLNQNYFCQHVREMQVCCFGRYK